jgi:hypothetical protein
LCRGDGVIGWVRGEARGGDRKWGRGHGWVRRLRKIKAFIKNLRSALVDFGGKVGCRKLEGKA